MHYFKKHPDIDRDYWLKRQCVPWTFTSAKVKSQMICVQLSVIVIG